ncbi:hypothetical protein SORBI_3007G093201 [Sorghum bicolor]|uniref:Ubiquitin-like domain-containing protein n=1 Tax=Sorghum bicolor TaxID=4558 RepID=A0A1Z5R8V9_SORBI|nr:hypothetical protein SORBI_3007G093201 [Sorghum bicolor]
MVKILSPRRLFRSRSRSTNISGGSVNICALKWRSPEDDAAAVEYILMIVSTGSWWHDVSIHATGTFGDQKVMLLLGTGLWPSEQRLLFMGKESDNCEHLHMVGVQDKDKLLLLEDLAVKERKFSLYLHCWTGISTGREGPVAPVPEPVLPFRD